MKHKWMGIFIGVIFCFLIVGTFVQPTEQINEVAPISKRYAKKTTSKKKSSETKKREQIVKYALKFVGNRYVYGGTSLTKGTDCSGFTMSVYKKFSISLSRTSRQQAYNGKKIKRSQLKKGDLVFYASRGRINHVALYIGNGKIVHASNPKSGIKISKMDYRKPYRYVSVL